MQTYFPSSKKRTAHKSASGFTLIELSIVLVIIGLIIGGVLVGKDLIAAAQLRAQIKQIDDFTVATNTFREKYGFLPGDMPPSQASQLGFFTFTGANAGKTCVGGYTAAFGNNDGIINSVTEAYVFWSHLGDSKLINGTYSGTAGSLLNADVSSCFPVPGGGQPDLAVSKISDSLPVTKLHEGSYVRISGNRYWAPATTTKFANTGKLNYFTVQGPHKASQLFQIDTKIDDGLPASGNVRDQSTGNNTSTPVEDAPCTTTGVTPIAYDLSAANAESLNCGYIVFFF